MLKNMQGPFLLSLWIERQLPSSISKVKLWQNLDNIPADDKRLFYRMKVCIVSLLQIRCGNHGQLTQDILMSKGVKQGFLICS